MRIADWEKIRWFGPAQVPYWEKLKTELLIGIDLMAHILNQTPIFTSTWRSEEENLRVGGASKSKHLTGEAADLVFPGKSLDGVYEAAKYAGFKGIGLYPEENMIHVDTRKKIGSWSRIAGQYLSINVALDYIKKQKVVALIVIVSMGLLYWLLKGR